MIKSLVLFTLNGTLQNLLLLIRNYTQRLCDTFKRDKEGY